MSTTANDFNLSTASSFNDPRDWFGSSLNYSNSNRRVSGLDITEGGNLHGYSTQVLTNFNWGAQIIPPPNATYGDVRMWYQCVVGTLWKKYDAKVNGPNSHLHKSKHFRMYRNEIPVHIPANAETYLYSKVPSITSTGIQPESQN
jgi:hypothetical protein